jgi:hypothetical protein
VAGACAVGFENHGRLMQPRNWLGSLLRDVGSRSSASRWTPGNLFTGPANSLDDAHRFLEESCALRC